MLTGNDGRVAVAGAAWRSRGRAEPAQRRHPEPQDPQEAGAGPPSPATRPAAPAANSRMGGADEASQAPNISGRWRSALSSRRSSTRLALALAVRLVSSCMVIAHSRTWPGLTTFRMPEDTIQGLLNDAVGLAPTPRHALLRHVHGNCEHEGHERRQVTVRQMRELLPEIDADLRANGEVLRLPAGASPSPG